MADNQAIQDNWQKVLTIPASVQDHTLDQKAELLLAEHQTKLKLEDPNSITNENLVLASQRSLEAMLRHLIQPAVQKAVQQAVQQALADVLPAAVDAAIARVLPRELANRDRKVANMSATVPECNIAWLETPQGLPKNPPPTIGGLDALVTADLRGFCGFYGLEGIHDNTSRDVLLQKLKNYLGIPIPIPD